MRDSDFSQREQVYLDRARAGDAEDVFQSLYSLTRGEDLPPGESLSPEWVQLWQQAKDDIIRYAPPTIIRRIELALSKIKPVEAEIFEVRLRDDQSVVLLLGAGASAPEPSSIPTVDGLLPELWQRARKVGREDIDSLQDWCQKHSVGNIEDLLTAAYIANFAAKNPSMTGLLDYFLFRGSGSEVEGERAFSRRRPSAIPRVDVASIAMVQETLQILFGLLTGAMIPAGPNPAHDAVVAFLKKHDRVTIITTNYDGCVDEALLRSNIPFSTLIDAAPDSGTKTIDLVKIHGSINWAYCDSCQSVREFDLLELKAAYEQDTHSYPVIGICKTCSGQRRPLLVPPMAFKFIMFPNLIRLWDTARQKIEGADYLIVVGYSFAEADTYISKIIARSMTVRKKQKIIVCDPNPRLVPALRDRFAAHIDNFDPRRVYQAAGPCEVLLPRILDSLVSDQPPAVTRPRQSEGPRVGVNNAGQVAVAKRIPGSAAKKKVTKKKVAKKRVARKVAKKKAVRKTAR